MSHSNTHKNCETMKLLISLRSVLPNFTFMKAIKLKLFSFAAASGSRKFYCCRRHKFHCCATLNIFIQSTVTCNATHTQRIVLCSVQQWLFARATILRYTYVVCLIYVAGTTKTGHQNSGFVSVCITFH